MFQYSSSLLRYIPNALAGEFANVGLLVCEVGPDSTIKGIRFAILKSPSETFHVSQFFPQYWSQHNWDAWTKSFECRMAEVQPRAIGMNFEDFRDLLYRPSGLGAFTWANTLNGCESSLDAAFDYYFVSMFMRKNKSA